MRLKFIIGSVVLALLVVGSGLYAQEKGQKLDATTAATSKANAIASRKSYPLPEALSNEIAKLVNDRNRAERALLDYISDPKIYSSDDEVVRAAMFDRQHKLFKQYGEAINKVGGWVVMQRKEFKCDACEAQQLADGKWLFREPETAATATAAATAQGGAK